MSMELIGEGIDAMIVIILGKNPNSGGTPIIDKILIEVEAWFLFGIDTVFWLFFLRSAVANHVVVE